MGRKRDWPIDQIRVWIEEEGRTHEWIAQRLDCASQSVGRVAMRNGIQSHRRGPRPGPGHPNWKGGRHIDQDGYVVVWVEGHPYTRQSHRRARPNGYVLEHRLVMEKHLGRYLEPGEVVHHVNGDKQDNRIENLEVFASNGEHLAHELKGRCPNWSEDGKARIREAVRQRHARDRQHRERDEQP